MTKMRIFILCTLLVSAWSRPQEQASDEKLTEKKIDQDNHERARLLGFGPNCTDVLPYPDRDTTGVTRFRFCWNEPGFEADKRMSEHAAREWERVANLTMEFLDNCDNRDANVTPIYISDMRPQVVPSFENCKYKAALMVLNFQLEKPKKSDYELCNSSNKSRDSCIKYYAMHEMGHAIGFRHEQYHPNSTCKIDKDFGIYSYSVETAYDRRSIMNYCNHAAMINPQLSQLDIQGVQKVYGRRG